MVIRDDHKRETGARPRPARAEELIQLPRADERDDKHRQWKDAAVAKQRAEPPAAPRGRGVNARVGRHHRLPGDRGVQKEQCQQHQDGYAVPYVTLWVMPRSCSMTTADRRAANPIRSNRVCPFSD